MKKAMIALSLVLAFGIFSAFAYADSPAENYGFNNRPWGNKDGYRQDRDFDSEEFDKWREERLEYRKDDLKKAVEEKIITEDEAKKWEDHFEYMDEFHEENGYQGGYCGGYNRGIRRGMGRHHMGW